jgi:malic enzyme
MKMAAALPLANYIEHPTEDMILPNPLDKGVADVVAEAMR